MEIMEKREHVESDAVCPRCGSNRVMPVSRDRESHDALTARCRECTMIWTPSPEQLVAIWWRQGYRDHEHEQREDPALARVLRGWPRLAITGRRVVEMLVTELLSPGRRLN